jgi:hypothetical protein
MLEHYRDLYKTSFQEYKFQWEQKMMLDDLISDTHKLLWKNIKHSLIQKYIENWREKIILNQSIHFDEIVWIDNVSFK